MEANVHRLASGYRADQMKAYLMPSVVEILYSVIEKCDGWKLRCRKYGAFQI